MDIHLVGVGDVVVGLEGEGRGGRWGRDLQGCARSRAPWMGTLLSYLVLWYILSGRCGYLRYSSERE